MAGDGSALALGIRGAAGIVLSPRNRPLGRAGPEPAEIGIRPEHVAIADPSDPRAE